MSKPTSSCTSRIAQSALSSSLSILPLGKPHAFPFHERTSSSFVQLAFSSIAPHVGICRLYDVNAS